MSASEAIAATVRVECDKCARTTGRVEPFGEMLLWPASLGGGWRWVPSGRRVDWDGSRKTLRFNTEGKASGGEQLKCRRCRHSPRVSIKRLAADAQRCLSAGVSAFTV